MDIALQVVLSPFLGVLFDRMAKPEFPNLFRKLKYDHRILKKLKWKLLILQGVLEDAENKQSVNPAVKEWLEELQEVAYQAEDLLDLINTEALRVKVESQFKSPTNQALSLHEVRNIEELSIPASLQSLSIDECDNLMSFNVGGLPAPNLTTIWLRNLPKLKSLPKRMHTLLSSLQILSLRKCPRIDCFPEGGLPSSLQFLEIGGDCKRLWCCCGEWGLQRLPSLTTFQFSDYPEDGEEETFPLEDLLLSCTLQSLRIWNCPKIRSFSEEQLPAFLSELHIGSCPELQSLPQGGLPASVSKLFIINCPLLKQRLECEKGEDWQKVAHIPCIRVDGELLP